MSQLSNELAETIQRLDDQVKALTTLIPELRKLPGQSKHGPQLNSAESSLRGAATAIGDARTELQIALGAQALVDYRDRPRAA